MTLNPTVALVGGVAVSLSIVAGWFLFRPKLTPEERERRRRLDISRNGRIRDAEVTDFRDNALYFTYTVAGVTYTTSQDISSLLSILPSDPAVLIGPAGVKYRQRNPVDSIVVCEEWTGLRIPAGFHHPAATRS
jgi:hypothetical protein